jgi:hypothetical protein
MDKDKKDEFIPIPISDVYHKGISNLKHDFTNRNGGLD